MTPFVDHLCQQFADRAGALGYTGKNRDKAALEFFLGALAVLKHQNSHHTIVTEKFAIYAISIRGYAAIMERLPKKTGERS